MTWWRACRPVAVLLTILGTLPLTTVNAQGVSRCQAGQVSFWTRIKNVRYDAASETSYIVVTDTLLRNRGCDEVTIIHKGQPPADCVGGGYIAAAGQVAADQTYVASKMSCYR